MPSRRAAARRRTVKRTRATKLAISLEPNLASQVQRAARRRAGGNVSAWLSEAAQQYLRRQAMEAALDAYEVEHGVITDAELATVRRKWPRG
jgi:hypothetical protein